MKSKAVFVNLWLNPREVRRKNYNAVCLMFNLRSGKKISANHLKRSQ